METEPAKVSCSENCENGHDPCRAVWSAIKRQKSATLGGRAFRASVSRACLQSDRRLLVSTTRAHRTRAPLGDVRDRAVGCVNSRWWGSSWWTKPVCGTRVDALELVLGGDDPFLQFAILPCASRSGRQGAVLWLVKARSPQGSNARIACCTKLEVTPPSFSSHSRYGTPVTGLPADASTSFQTDLFFAA
jgi:hypothetical protein